MRLHSLYRYPVKGLTPERLAQATLSPGRCLPWDRAFALAQGDAKLDPEHPAWIPKSNFMCLAKNAKAALLNTSFDEAAGTLDHCRAGRPRPHRLALHTGWPRRTHQLPHGLPGRGSPPRR